MGWDNLLGYKFSSFLTQRLQKDNFSQKRLKKISWTLVCVCVCVFIYTIFISIICVSQEEPSLIAYNQQIYNFYEWIIFEKKRHCGKWIFDISELFITSCNKDGCFEHITGGVNMYLYGCQSTGPWVCCVCLCVIRVPVRKTYVKTQQTCHLIA